MDKNFGIIDKAVRIYSDHCTKSGETFRAPERARGKVDKITGKVELFGYDGSLIVTISTRTGKVIPNPNNEADQELIRQAINDYRAECKRKGIPYGSPVPAHCRVDHNDQKVVLYNGTRIVGLVYTGSQERKKRILTSF